MTEILTPATIERQLAELRGEKAGDQSGTRTHIVDLGGYADEAWIADELGTVVAQMRHHRPSRALIACGDAAAGDVTAEPSVFCAPMQEGGSLVCCELVRLHGPGTGESLTNMVASLLLPDLPVFLLWLAPPAFERTAFTALAALATRVVTDSTRYPETLDRLPVVVADDRVVVTDLAWTKITGWREVVAGIFDDTEHRALLDRLERVSVRYVRGSDAQARLLYGWLASSTGTDPVADLAPVDKEDMRAGSLVRVELDAGGQRFVIDRPIEGVAVVTAPDRAERRAALRVPPFGTLVGEELEFLAHDRAFLDALAVAADSSR
jgi:glucose-6-phosphate dehydrogenase assembly protein OpcA